MIFSQPGRLMILRAMHTSGVCWYSMPGIKILFIFADDDHIHAGVFGLDKGMI